MSKQCQYCGAQIDDNAVRCPVCKEWLDNNIISFDTKQREFLPTALLSFFLGMMGLHRFYTGYFAIGLIQLLTFGGCGIWTLIDFLSICFNNFKDAEGRLLKNYDKNIGIVLFVIMLIPFIFILLLFLGIVIALLFALAAKL